MPMNLSHLKTGTPGGTGPRWTPAEDATLRRLWRTATEAELLAALPGRNWSKIRHRAYERFRLGMKERPR